MKIIFSLILLFAPFNTYAISFELLDDSSFTSNHLGMAIDPTDGHIFVTTLSYGGEDNLWEYDSATGELVNSARVNLDLGDGNLSEITIGNDGQLFIKASEGAEGNTHTIYKVSRDGQTIFSSFEDHNTAGLDYDMSNDNLLIYSSSSAFVDTATVLRTDLNGNILFSSQIDVILDRITGDIAFDENSGNLYVASQGRYYDGDSQYFNLLSEFSLDETGNYQLVQNYDFGFVSHSLFTLDFNPYSGLFYAGTNELVYEFTLDELSIFDPPPPEELQPPVRIVPEPTSLTLLGIGLIGICVARCRKV